MQKQQQQQRKSQTILCCEYSSLSVYFFQRAAPACGI